MHFFLLLLLTFQQFIWGLKALDSNFTAFEYDIRDADHTISNARMSEEMWKADGTISVWHQGLSCSRHSSFYINCSYSTNPSNIQVHDISNSELRISNPYFSAGCQDIDECKQPTHGCEHLCNNSQGSYNCSCRSGYYTDSNNLNKCIAKTSKSQPIKYILGMGFACLSIIIGTNWLYCIMSRKKNTQQRDKFFHQNGGLLLKQQSNSEGGAMEFVPNGTLFHHVHNIDGVGSWLSLESRLRIAAESSGALAYLHSAVSIPIIHRDVKLANILLDNNNVAKISDFGASRLIPMDQTEVTSLVQGTLGYLDPEYFHTGQLTEKSDVYSFGVVLAELLTGRQPICMANPQEERNLATYFITSLKENRLLQIIEPRLVKEGTFDQLQKAAQLVKRCLNLNGDDRPTMKEVTMEIESLRKFTKHPWANENGSEDTTSLISHTELQHSDLYEIQLSSYHNVATDSEQYSSSTISLLHPPNSPR